MIKMINALTVIKLVNINILIAKQWLEIKYFFFY